MRLLSLSLPFLVILSPLPTLAAGDGTLFTDAVTYCAEAKAVVVDEFDIAYHQSNGSVTFTFSLASVESNLNVSANLYINAYGMEIINQTLNLCDLLEGVICPLPQVNFTGYGTYPIPAQYTSKIPGIAYTVPNLEAYARVQLLRDGTGDVAACLQATLSNGYTTRQKGVAIATGIFTLVALLVGLFHTAAVNSPSPAQHRWFDILYLFQTAAASGLLHLNYPLVYSNFTENFSWALGLFHSNAMQSSINKMRFKTGGHLSGDAYSDVQYINRRYSPFNVLVNLNEVDTPASFKSFLAGIPQPRFVSRATIPSALAQNSTTELDTGIPVYVNTLRIPEANAFDTIFFFFLAFIAIALVFHAILFLVIAMVDRFRNGKSGTWATRLRRMWWDFCAGNALRICLIWFLPVWIFGFWQFRIGDSGLSIFFAVFAILLTLVPLATAFALSLLRSRKPSSTAPTISPLYTSYQWFHSVGVLYRAYRQRFHYFWFAPLVLAMIARAGFIAFGSPRAWAQVIGNIVVEAIVLVALLACRPHKDRKGDWLVAFLSFCRLAAFGLLIAFIPSVGVKPIPRTIIGLVIVVLYGVPTILLFLGLIWNLGYGYWWRRHTHLIEDGAEVERFVSSDDDSQTRPAMMSSQVDAANFVSSRPTMGIHNDDGRAGSLIEPIGANVYEPTHQVDMDNSPAQTSHLSVLADNHHPGLTPYHNAAMGYGQYSDSASDYRAPSLMLDTRATSRTSHYYTPGDGQSTPRDGFYTPGDIITNPSDENHRLSRDNQYFGNNARY